MPPLTETVIGVFWEHQNGRPLGMSHRGFVDTLSDAVEIFSNCKTYLTWLNMKGEQVSQGITRRSLSAWTHMDDPKISFRNITVTSALEGQQL